MGRTVPVREDGGMLADGRHDAPFCSENKLASLHLDRRRPSIDALKLLRQV